MPLSCFSKEQSVKTVYTPPPRSILLPIFLILDDAWLYTPPQRAYLMIHASSYFSFSTAGASSTSASSYVPCHLRFVPYQPTPLLLVTHIWIHIEFLHLVIPVPKSYPNAQSLHELIPGCSFETPMAKNSAGEVGGSSLST